MKSFILLILLTYPISAWGQQNLFPPKGVRLVSTPSEFQPKISASPGSESLKIKHKAMKEGNTIYTIYTKEFRNQKYVPDPFDLTETASTAKDGILSWILVPDTANCQHVKIYSHYLSGSVSIRERAITEPDKYFDYKFFHYTEELAYGKEIPLLIIFESDMRYRSKQTVLDKFIKDGKLNPEDKEEITSKLDRYLLVYYIAK